MTTLIIPKTKYNMTNNNIYIIHPTDIIELIIFNNDSFRIKLKDNKMCLIHKFDNYQIQCYRNTFDYFINDPIYLKHTDKIIEFIKHIQNCKIKYYDSFSQLLHNVEEWKDGDFNLEIYNKYINEL